MTTPAPLEKNSHDQSGGSHIQLPTRGPVQPDTRRILPGPLYAALPPQTVLAADGLYPNFTGVSLLSWNV